MKFRMHAYNLRAVNLLNYVGLWINVSLTLQDRDGKKNDVINVIAFAIEAFRILNINHERGTQSLRIKFVNLLSFSCFSIKHQAARCTGAFLRKHKSMCHTRYIRYFFFLQPVIFSFHAISLFTDNSEVTLALRRSLIYLR